MAKGYTKQDMVRILKNDVEVPEVVDLKIHEAFKQIKEGSKQAKKKRRNLRWQAAAAVMGIMIIGTASVGAAGFFLWNPDVAEKFEADEVQQQELEIKKVTVPTPQEASCTNNGVTISLEQSLTTEKHMYMYFKITAPEDMKLSENTFLNEKMLLNGKPIEANYCGGMPDELEEDGADNVTYWEYTIEWREKTDLNGQTFTAHFDSIEESDKAAFGPIIAEGPWDVSWTLEYAPSEQTFDIDQQLEKEGVTVDKVIISPISLEFVYKLEDRGGEWVPPFEICQYRMKDGTTEEISCDGMYSAELLDKTTYVESNGLGKVYTVEDIAGVIIRNYESGETYEINLK